MTSQREMWGTTLADIAEENERLVVVDGDVANSTRADIFAERHPERFLQMGIAEQNMIGVATGLSLQGYVPWVSSFTPFMTHRAIDPIRMLVAQTNANVKIAGAYAGLLTGLTGRTHQDVQDIAIMRAMPNVTLLSPADGTEVAAMVRWATDHAGPVYLRVARDPGDEISGHDYTFALGAVLTVRQGDDVVLVSTGAQTARVLRSAEQLSEHGIQARVVHVPSIKPLDQEQLISALDGAPLVVSVEEHSVLGGLGGAVAEIVTERGGAARLVRIGLQDLWTESAPNDFLLDKYGLSSDRVTERVRSLLGDKSRLG
jgi:transketolase